MILCCGIPSEAPLRLVIEAAASLDVEAVVFNQRYAHEIEMEYTASGNPGIGLDIEGHLRIDEKVYSLASFSGIYVRLMDYLQLSTLNPQPSTDHLASLHTSLIDWIEVAPQRVMNRLGAMGSNQSKPYQAQLIQRAGFLTPPTLITNDPEEVHRFLEAHQRVIYKSISAIRSVVQELDRPRLHDFEKIRYLPTQFQAFIPGENIRVHVAGEKVLATRIATPAVDYRYAGQQGLDSQIEAVYIESDIADRCRELAYQLDLPLCGIDLKRTPTGEYVCFEANPSPAFSFYQEATGQDIAGAIVRWLAGLE